MGFYLSAKLLRFVNFKTCEWRLSIQCNKIKTNLFFFLSILPLEIYFNQLFLKGIILTDPWISRYSKGLMDDFPTQWKLQPRGILKRNK